MLSIVIIKSNLDTIIEDDLLALLCWLQEGNVDGDVVALDVRLGYALHVRDVPEDGVTGDVRHRATRLEWNLQ